MKTYSQAYEKYILKERDDKQFYRQPVYFERVKEGHPHIGKYVVWMTKVISEALALKMAIEYNKMVRARGEDPEMFATVKTLGGAIMVRKLTVGDHVNWINKDLLEAYYKGGDKVGEG